MAGWVVDGSNWMAGIPEGTALCDLSIPGTHESCSLFGGGRSQCQWLSIRDQLELGVRFLDVRCSNIDGSGLADAERNNVERDDDFHLFHGSEDEKDWFSSVQKQCARFLADHPTETILMNVQREEVGRYFNRDKSEFADKFNRCVATFSPPDIWSYVKPTPADKEWTIGGCRGKIILIRSGWPRPSGTSTFGLPWTGNRTAGYSKDALFWTQNGWEGAGYDTDAKKLVAVKLYLDFAADVLAPDTRGSGADKFYLNFLSRAAGDTVGTSAQNINEDIQRYLQGAMANRTGKLGVLPIDFVGNTGWRDSLEDWIIRRNTFQAGCAFQSVAKRCTVQIGRYDGERRWNSMVAGEDPWVRADTATAQNPALVLQRVIDEDEHRILFKSANGKYLNVSDDGRVGLFDSGTSFYALPGKLVSEKAGKQVAVTPTGGLWCVDDAGVSTEAKVNLIEQ